MSPLTSRLSMPAASIAAMHASTAIEAAVTSPEFRLNPVVAADANATWSFAGLRPAIVTRACSSVGRQLENGEWTAVALDPGKPDALTDLEFVVGSTDHRAREPQTFLFVELDGDDRVGSCVVDAFSGWALVQQDQQVHGPVAGDGCGDQVLRPALRAHRLGAMV